MNIKKSSCLFRALIAAAIALGADESATVTIRNAHLCCGGCVDGAKSALDGVDGVSDVKADVNSKSIIFTAKSEKAATAAPAAPAAGAKA